MKKKLHQLPLLTIGVINFNQLYVILKKKSSGQSSRSGQSHLNAIALSQSSLGKLRPDFLDLQKVEIDGSLGYSVEIEPAAKGEKMGQFTKELWKLTTRLKVCDSCRTPKKNLRFFRSKWVRDHIRRSLPKPKK